MSDRDHAAMLLDMARRDLIAADAMQDATVFADEIVGFHVQQAIEKSLKAWLAICGAEYPKTHDISLLLHHLAEHDVDTEPFDDAIQYTMFAVQYRYESFHTTDDPLDRQVACRSAKQLIEHVAAVFEQTE